MNHQSMEEDIADIKNLLTDYLSPHMVSDEIHAAHAKHEQEQKLERLRDEFAMHMNTNELSLEAAEILMGKRPKFDSFNLEVMQWWMDAESKYRYMCADAALKAREIK